MTQVSLLPLSPDKKYSEVQLEIHHEYDPDPAGGFRIADNPDDPAFAPFRQAYDRIAQGFVRRLR